MIGCQAAETTELLRSWGRGEPNALNRLTPRVYHELRRIARHYMQNESPARTIQATGLVHEAYLKLVDQTRAQWQDRAQFFAVAATSMRRVLVEYARRANATRRGGGSNGKRHTRISVEDVQIPVVERAAVLVDLDEALQRLALVDARLAQIVECRFFAGLTESETAAALSLSQRTVAREWVVAKAWLFQDLADAEH